MTHTAELIVEFQQHHEKIMAEVTDQGKNSFILEFSWLKCHNPDIDWTKGTVKIVTVGPGRNDCRPRGKGLSTKNLAYRRDESYG